MEAEAASHTPSDALALAKAETRGDKLGDLKVEALLNTLAKTLAIKKDNTLLDTLGDVDCEALGNTSADTLAKVDSNPHCDRMGHVQTKALINTLAVALEQKKPKHLAEHRVIWRPWQTLGDSLSDVQAHPLAATIADTLPEAKG